jgi:hypothetical protein
MGARRECRNRRRIATSKLKGVIPEQEAGGGVVGFTGACTGRPSKGGGQETRGGMRFLFVTGLGMSSSISACRGLPCWARAGARASTPAPEVNAG